MARTHQSDHGPSRQLFEAYFVDHLPPCAPGVGRSTDKSSIPRHANPTSRGNAVDLLDPMRRVEYVNSTRTSPTPAVNRENRATRCGRVQPEGGMDIGCTGDPQPRAGLVLYLADVCGAFVADRVSVHRAFRECEDVHRRVVARIRREDCVAQGGRDVHLRGPSFRPRPCLAVRRRDLLRGTPTSSPKDPETFAEGAGGRTGGGDGGAS